MHEGGVGVSGECIYIYLSGLWDGDSWRGDGGDCSTYLRLAMAALVRRPMALHLSGC